MKDEDKWNLVASIASDKALNRYFSFTHVVFEHRSYYGTTYSCKQERQYKCPLRVKVSLDEHAFLWRIVFIDCG